MAAIEIFKNESFGIIRTAGTSEEPLFCLADICNAVDIVNSRNVKNRLDEDDVHLIDIIDNLGRPQQAVFVSEAGMYDAVLKSDSPKARPFSRWITHDVLPTLRKTGSYSTANQSKPASVTPTKVRAGIEWVRGVSEMLNLNDASKLSLLEKVATPLGLPLPDYTPSHGVLKSATDLLKENDYPISAQVFNQKAIDKGILCERERTSSHGRRKKFKLITEKGLEYGENHVHPNNPKETQPQWYVDKFGSLMSVLGFSKEEELSYGN